MKAQLMFDLDVIDDRERFETIAKAEQLKNALYETRMEIFRPARKHGYPEPQLQKLMEEHPEVISDLMEALEKKFNEILRDNKLEEFDL